MNQNNSNRNFENLIGNIPTAVAVMHGGRANTGINGSVQFYQTTYGIFVIADITGLPQGTGECDSPIFALHIHEGSSCSGNDSDPFADVGMHYNPNNCPHPYHAGDMPPLFSANGSAFSAFITDRFSIDEVMGRTVIIHSSPDDFTTQPSGNSGTKIACGVIMPVKR